VIIKCAPRRGDDFELRADAVAVAARAFGLNRQPAVFLATGVKQNARSFAERRYD